MASLNRRRRTQRNLGFSDVKGGYRPIYYRANYLF